MEALGGCSSKLSREHIVSGKVLQHISEAEVGLTDVAPDGSLQTIGAGSATIKNLCDHHNGGTSPLDDEAQRLVAAVESFLRLDPSERLISAGAPTERTVVIDGHSFERWTVKTFINVFMHGNARYKDVVLPTVDLINPALAEYVFNGRTPLFPQGLYTIKPGVPLLDPPHGHTHNYLFRPIAAIVQHRSTGSRRQLPVFFHLKMKVWHFGTIANLTSLSDDRFISTVDQFFTCHQIPAEFRPTSKGLRNTPDDAPLTHTMLRVQFKW